MTWDTERTERLVALHHEGKTAGEISTELSVTRNAVIGKLHRLGVTRKKRQPVPTEQVQPEPQPQNASAPWDAKDVDQVEDDEPQPEEPEAEDDRDRIEVHRLSAKNAEKVSPRLSLMELTSRTCKWPIGDPASDEFWFCGLASTPGKPYCEAHNNLACQPFTSRRDRKLARKSHLRTT